LWLLCGKHSKRFDNLFDVELLIFMQLC
jgi:hypothetical protein